MCCPCAIQITPFGLPYGLFFTTQGHESRSTLMRLPLSMFGNSGFDAVNVHRPTVLAPAAAVLTAIVAASAAVDVERAAAAAASVISAAVTSRQVSAAAASAAAPVG